jgi:imidazolonepropionase-like amidohydrolase
MVTVENGKITRVDRGAPSSPASYELGGATLMPGLIDAHVHLNWYFNAQGRYHSGNDGDTPAQSLLAILENGDATLRAGITTIQGLANGGLHPLQRAFHEEHALQCGYCTPGMIMAASDLLRENPNPSDDEIRDGLEGNLCRCTGYENIVRAVRRAAQAGVSE